MSLVGGGSHTLQPGEISLAHRGVLFLDELGEFEPNVLDNLRQPLEEGVIRVARAMAKVAFPEGESRLGGIPLVFVGGIFLAHNYDVMRIHQSWPLFIVAAGLGVLANSWSSSTKKEGQ